MMASEKPIDSQLQSEAETATANSVEELQQAYQSLRSRFQILLVALLFLVGSVFVFLLHQVSTTRRQVRELTQIVASQEKNNVPLMRQFRDKLIEFAKSNDDFKPILLKYVNATNLGLTPQAPGLSQPQTAPPPDVAPLAPPK